MWTESHLSQLRPDWNPHHKRQQQLLNRLHRALHGTAARHGGWVDTRPRCNASKHGSALGNSHLRLEDPLDFGVGCHFTEMVKSIFSYPVDLADCVLALGFEKMERGSLSAKVWHIFPLNAKMLSQLIYPTLTLYPSLWTGPTPWTSTWRWWSTATGWLLPRPLPRCSATPAENTWRNMVNTAQFQRMETAFFVSHAWMFMLDLFQALNQNTLPKSPGKTTNIPPITRKGTFLPGILESVYGGLN